MSKQEPIPQTEKRPQKTRHKNALPAGFLLGGIYRIQAILGHGGFGITYLGLDEHYNRRVAIKEYLPNEFAVRSADYRVVAKSEEDRKTFQWGLDRFAQEARTLERFDHPNIVRVLRFLRFYGTAYLVMEYRDGKTLKAYMAERNNQPLDENSIRRIFLPVLDGLRAVHQEGLLHRDIKPDNIFLRGENLSPMLIDFGSARFALGEKSRSLSIVVSAGYAPFEQYSSSGNQGPWTDVYGVGASIHLCAIGQPPPESSQRGSALLDGETDPYLPVTKLGLEQCYSEPFLRCIDDALAFRVKDRLQSAWKFQRLLKGDFDWQPEQRIDIDTDHRPAEPGTESAAAQKGPPPSSAKPWWRHPLALSVFGLGIAAAGWGLFHTFANPLSAPARTTLAPPIAASNSMTPGGLAREAEMQAFDAAERKRGLDAYRTYFANCTFCIDAPLAQRRIAELQQPSRPPPSLFEAARQQGTRAAYQAYLNGCAPKCAETTTARTLVETLPGMVLIRGGRFQMGSNDDEPERGKDERRHWVRVLDFYLGKQEITNAEYVRFLNSVQQRGNPDRPWFQDNREDPDSRIVHKKGIFHAKSGYEDHPVIEVSWYGANAYTQWLSRRSGHHFRLPTEAEWEYAARAGTTTPFYSGQCITTAQANYDGRTAYAGCPPTAPDFIGAATAVSTYPANPWGLAGILGNVMEWSCSQYSATYNGEEQRCAHQPTLPVLRGGAWSSPPQALRTAARYRNFAGYRNDTVGFRVAKEISLPLSPEESRGEAVKPAPSLRASNFTAKP